MSRTLTVEAISNPNYEMFALDGALDSDTAPAFEKQLLDFIATKPAFVLLNMEKLSYISSAGLRVVTRGMKATKQYGGSLRLVNLQPQIKKVFDIVSLVPVNQIFSSVAELDDYLDKMQRGSEET